MQKRIDYKAVYEPITPGAGFPLIISRNIIISDSNRQNIFVDVED